MWCQLASTIKELMSKEKAFIIPDLLIVYEKYVLQKEF